MAKTSDADSSNLAGDEVEAKTCGIVMPISAMGDDYPEEHWRRVRKILQKAIERAGLRPRLVWENAEIDVIQSAILQNLYENDVVVCDVSGLNPNVMLETGLRLSTKRPTVIVTDRIARPPFDISTFGYVEYQRDLEFNAIEDFIDRLSTKLSSILEAYESGTYKSFVENFKFETVVPTTVSVPAEEYLKEQLDGLSRAIRRVERFQREGQEQSRGPSSRNDRLIDVIGEMSSDKAKEVESELDSLAGFGFSAVSDLGNGKFRFTIPLSDTSRRTIAEGYQIVRGIVRTAEEDESDAPF